MFTHRHSRAVLVGGTNCILLACSIAALRGATQLEEPPAVPRYESREQMVAAIVAGNLKTIKLPKEMPDGVQLTKDIEFGKAGEHCLKLDLYRPAKLDRPVPGLIFIHGGAWKGGTKDMYRPYAVHYAQKGYVAASISYRLSSVAPFPAAVEDAKCAVRWMRAGADKYGVDPNHICVLGGSAGGHLAMMVAYSWPDKQLQGSGGHEGASSKVQAVVSFYGPSDLTAPRVRDADVVRQFLGGKKYEDSPDLYRRASPIFHLSKDDPPTLILHGTIDALVPISQSDRLIERLKQLGIPYVYDRLEGWPHVMDLAEPVFNRCIFFIDRFLAAHMPVPQPVVP